MTQRDLFPRSVGESKFAHVYESRQAFVSDVCQGVSALLKEKKELLKKGRVYSTIYHHSFEIKDNDKNGVWNIAEEWDIQLTIMEDIEVVRMVQRDYQYRTKNVYFGEELKTSKDDHKYNRLENITALREFLKRECLGVGMADKPRETLSKDSIMFNLLLTLLEDSLTEWDGIKDKDFRDHVCRETGMSKEYFNELVKEYWGD